MPARVGFFQFGDECEDVGPIRSLKKSLCRASKNERLDDCLIVIPEAFNILGYRGANRFDSGIAGSLKKTSAEFKVAIVAGLGEEPPMWGRQLRYSSAYLIDGSHNL